jgi:hypothetical protein
MLKHHHQTWTIVLAVGWMTVGASAQAFEGCISATATQGGQTLALLYTASTNELRLEVTGSDRPDAVDVVDLRTGTLTLVFPHSRSFVRVPRTLEGSLVAPPGIPTPSGNLPPGVGPQASAPTASPAEMPKSGLPAGLPPGIGPRPGMPDLPVPGTPEAPRTSRAGLEPPLPAMPMTGELMQLKATGLKTNLLGFACEQYKIEQRGEFMEIWATPALLPFQEYIRNQPSRIKPMLIKEQWSGLLADRKLFPLWASLRYEHGVEQFRFEVQAVTLRKLKPDEESVFQPPEGYVEIRPLSF